MARTADPQNGAGPAKAHCCALAVGLSYAGLREFGSVLIVLACLLLLGWWLTGSYWPLLPTWFLFMAVFSMGARHEGQWHYPVDFLWWVALLALAAAPNVTRQLVVWRQIKRAGHISCRVAA